MADAVFRQIKKEELSEMFSLILQRIEWMDEVGIEQWNCTDYANVYPLSSVRGYVPKNSIYKGRDSVVTKR